MAQLATFADNRLRLTWIVFIIHGLTSIISTESAGKPMHVHARCYGAVYTCISCIAWHTCSSVH